MPQINPSSNLGPLPKSDRNRELQELSLQAFERALPVNRFQVRDERIADYGVDASLELLIDGYFTNMRAQIQLKGTDSTNTNADGTISLSVDTSNVNYLRLFRSCRGHHYM
jgi:hypothetical protein